MSKKIKLEIEALPCNNKYITGILWALVICFTVDEICGILDFGDSDWWFYKFISAIFSLATGVLGFIFFYCVANGCKALGEKYTILFKIYGALLGIMGFLGIFGEDSEIIYLFFEALFLILSFVLGICFWKNYEGKLQTVGKGLVWYPTILIWTLFKVLKYSGRHSDGALVYLIIGLIASIVIYIYMILIPLYKLLREGIWLGIWEDELREQIAEVTGEKVPTPNRDNSGGEPLAVKEDSHTFKTRWAKIIIICVSSLIGLALILFCIYKFADKPSANDSYDEYNEYAEEEPAFDPYGCEDD